MLRSLFTGISGLSAHQEMLDVTANNIANVNTTGYKSSSVQFEDTLSQTMATGGGAVAGTPGGASTGGTNPTQVGLGVQVGSTDMDFTQGSNQATGIKSNMLINGDGFFVVSTDGLPANVMYSRAGDFTPDSAGHLVLPDGAMLMQVATGGTTPDGPLVIPTDATGYSIDKSGKVSWTLPAGSTPSTGSAQISVASFANPTGLLKTGNSEYTASNASGTAQFGTASSGSIGSITTGYVEMSNVDLASQLTNLIISQRGFQANSKVITTSDQILQTLVNMVN